MNARRDCYQVLGVPSEADAKALKKAFRQLARRYHPDTSTEPDAEDLADVQVDRAALGQGLVQGVLAGDRAQRGLGDLADRRADVLDRQHGFDRVDHPAVGHRGYVDADVVAGDDALRLDRHGDDPHRDLTAGGLSPLAAGPAALPAALPRRDPDPMKGWFAHRDFADRDAADLGKLDDLLPSPPHVVADRACCPARPVVTVIMPAAPGRPHPVDLLLCGHHFRVSQAALTAAGAAVYDDTGALIAGGASEYEHDLREHAAAA